MSRRTNYSPHHKLCEKLQTLSVHPMSYYNGFVPYLRPTRGLWGVVLK